MSTDAVCPRCSHPVDQHSPNTGMCTWQGGGYACKCLGPDQAARVAAWPKTRPV